MWRQRMYTGGGKSAASGMKRKLPYGRREEDGYNSGE